MVSFSVDSAFASTLAAAFQCEAKKLVFSFTLRTSDVVNECGARPNFPFTGSGIFFSLEDHAGEKSSLFFKGDIAGVDMSTIKAYPSIGRFIFSQ